MADLEKEEERHEKEKGESGGTLLDINLTDVLQVLSVNRKTCTLFLRKDDEKGEIYLREGKVIDARAGELRAEEALFYLLDWEGADFFIGTSVDSGVRVRIEKDLHTLMLDWIEHKDAQKKEKVMAVGPKAVARGEEEPERDEETVAFLRELEVSGVIKPIKT